MQAPRYPDCQRTGIITKLKTIQYENWKKENRIDSNIRYHFSVVCSARTHHYGIVESAYSGHYPLDSINFWQTLGLTVLCRLLCGTMHHFRGCFPHGHHFGHHHHHGRLHNMSPEEREAFVRRRFQNLVNDETSGKDNLTTVFTTFRQKLLTFITCRVSSERCRRSSSGCFLRLLQTEENVSVEQISAWLYKVARNRIIDYRRKKGETSLSAPSDGQDDIPLKQITDILIENGADPEQEYLRKFIWEEIEKALNELPKEQREVFEQTEFENKSYEDIASASGVPLKTLLSRKHYAVVSLRKRLKKIYEIILYTD